MILASGARGHEFEVMYLAIRYQLVFHMKPHDYAELIVPTDHPKMDSNHQPLRLTAESPFLLRHGEQHKEIFKYFEKFFSISQWKIFYCW